MSSSSVKANLGLPGYLLSDTPTVLYAAFGQFIAHKIQKTPDFLVFGPQIRNLTGISPNSPRMLSEEHIQQLIRENEYLQVQLEEVNEVLAGREAELEDLKRNAAEATELRSRLDARLDELHSMQNQIGEKEQQAYGAEEREIQLQNELTEAMRVQHQYDELVGHYTYIQAQLADVQARLEELTERNRELQKIAGQIGELESRLANSVMEKEALLKQLGQYQDQSQS